MKILILEDNEEDREIIRRMLVQHGHTDLQFIETRAEAEALLPIGGASEDFLFLCDLNVPDSETAETIEWLATEIKHRVVIITGSEPTSVAMAALLICKNVVAFVNKAQMRDIVLYLDKTQRTATVTMQAVADAMGRSHDENPAA